MSWVRIDDGFPDHPRIAALSDKAFRAQVRALCYSAHLLTDGAVPAAVAAVLAPAKIRKELVAAGVWDEAKGGYEIHDYLDFNPSKESTLAKRDAARNAARSRWSNAESVPSASPSALPTAMPPLLGAGTGRGSGGLDLGGGSGGRAGENGAQIAKPRARDEVFEAVAEACSVDWHGLTDTARGTLNKVVAEIKRAGGTPDEIHRRAQNWPSLFPDATLTPPALAKHWGALAKRRQTHSKTTNTAMALADELEAQGR